jgi:hypothetical protein
MIVNVNSSTLNLAYYNVVTLKDAQVYNISMVVRTSKRFANTAFINLNKKEVIIIQ